MERSLSATAEPPTFTCDVQPERDRVRVALAGELDLATVEPLKQGGDAVRRLFELTGTQDALPFVEAR